MAGVPAGGNTLKTVLIGIGTTVAAYAIVSLLGIGKGGKSSEATIQKQATIEAWSSVNDYIFYSAEKLKTIACFSCDELEMKRELVRELDNSTNSLKNLKENKSIDDKMQSIIDRTIQQFTDLKPIYIEYFDSLAYIRTLPDPIQLAESVRIQGKYLGQIAHIQSRDSTELKNYLRDINKKHKMALGLKQTEIEFRPESLPRKWKIECTFTIEFKKSGNVEWIEGENVFKGTWILDKEEKILNIKLETNQEFNYTVFLLSEKLLVYYDREKKAYLAACPQ